MKSVNIEKLNQICGPVAAGLGYELVDLEWKNELGGWILRVYIDRPDGSGQIGVEDCTAVSHAISPVLDVEDAITQAYSLEVSSPGLNRPLRAEKDFKRFLGKKAKIRTKVPVADGAAAENARRNFSGTLVGVDGGNVRIDVGDKTFDVPIVEVEKANLVYEF